MGNRINFINPFGTPIYNDLIEETLSPYLRRDNELVVSNTEDCPPNPDWWYPKHLVEEAVFEDVIKAEKDGFDAVIVGCCYDPGVRPARELVDIPVIGPLEATMQFAPYFGHDYVLITDHNKAATYMRDLVRLYGQESQCRDVTSIAWWINDMVNDTESVARDALKAVENQIEERNVEVAILACTIISASLEKSVLDSVVPRDTTILNPNTFSLKMAESLADLKASGAYGISRRGYYKQMQQDDAEGFADVRRRYSRQ